MRKQRTKLVEEGNTIYEIDLDCMKRREEREISRKKEKEQKRSINDYESSDIFLNE